MDPSCVNTWISQGFSPEVAEKMCERAREVPRRGSDPSVAKNIPHPRTKNDHALVPLGRMTSRASDEPMAETMSMSAMGGRGWSFRSGYLGSGAVVFPDSKKAAKDFLSSLSSPLGPEQKDSWMVYADRIGMPKDAAEREWAAMSSPKLRPKLWAESTIKHIFEATSWWGYSVPHPHMVKMSHGGPQNVHPKMAPDKKSPEKKDNSPFAAAEPSFPFHTKASGKVYTKALQLVKLFPLDNPTEILKKAIRASGVTPIVDLTPEDEKLLRMAIEAAQNGPPKTNVRLGGAPGGPFNSTDSGYTSKRGAP